MVDLALARAVHVLAVVLWIGGVAMVTMLVFLVMVTYWPAMSTWLPKTLGMM